MAMGTTLQKIVDQDPSSVSEDVVEIDLDEFQQAQQDPVVHGFLTNAQAYGEALEREGRDR
jgi:hypothetical protein